MSQVKSASEAAAALNSGQILLLQTDTLPGLHARADHSHAIDRLQRIKGRNQPKPLVILAGNLSQARLALGTISPEQEEILHRHWPGPFSFILPAANRVNQAVVGGTGTVAVRVPAADSLCRLLLRVDFPVASTSANIAGESPCLNLAEAVAKFAAEVDGYWSADLSARCGVPRKHPQDSFSFQPSALIDLTEQPPRLLRAGPLPFPTS